MQTTPGNVSPFLTEGVFLPESNELNPKSDTEFAKYKTIDEVSQKAQYLGHGSFGKVVLMKNSITSEQVAIKAIEKSAIKQHTTLKDLKKEINIHQRLIHENIIRLIESIETKNHFLIVLEYAPKGDLFKLLKRKSKFTEPEAFLFFTQICNAIHFLHTNHLMHRDIKPENILLTCNNQVKLCDFGCCGQAYLGRKTLCGTSEYIAPEILKRCPYNEKADIWSLGILLYEMIHGYTPFKGTTDYDIYRNILENKPTFSAEIKEDLKSLIKSMLNANPEKRPTVEQILEHAWIQRVYKDSLEIELRFSTKQDKNRCSIEEKSHTQLSTENTLKNIPQIHEFLESEEPEISDFGAESKAQFSQSFISAASDIPRTLLYQYPGCQENAQTKQGKIMKLCTSKSKVINLSKAKVTLMKIVKEEKAPKKEKGLFSAFFSIFSGDDV